MTALRSYGTMPTAYGITVPVFYPDSLEAGEPDHVLFTPEGAAFCAGIYEPAARERYIAAAKATGVMPPFEEYGGHKCPRVPLPRPDVPVYPKMPGKDLTPVEEWITGILDHHRWCDRAEFLLGIIGENLRQVAVGEGVLGEFYPLSLSMLLTATLEHLGETEIDCLEAAALYALSMHGEWIEAGTEWLEPFRETWFRDWAAARPDYVALARGLRVPMDLPIWLVEIEGGVA
ncbi:hypothetical protein WYO_5466 [Methylobacterium sp. GXF4]|uniref:hypothetical protein n=1 Tax=Methylobacterium sp. GXF4 TaxID=1096546 RepID=UPI000269AA02|nr:hypothetical protein [Methylobacterium sp. GXF4]EIZ81878.1 hypothetical protein WYO_5466 [Methylobacterium sp. GXF4]